MAHEEVERSSLVMAHRARIINYIEANLGDPDLRPMRIAEACHMTTRNLHHLFSDEGETVARYILRRRLEECSRALADASQRGRTVTEIAFNCGFNCPTHFGRAFRARYGLTPRDYRRRKCPPRSMGNYQIRRRVVRESGVPSSLECLRDL